MKQYRVKEWAFILAWCAEPVICSHLFIAGCRWTAICSLHAGLCAVKQDVGFPVQPKTGAVRWTADYTEQHNSLFIHDTEKQVENSRHQAVIAIGTELLLLSAQRCYCYRQRNVFIIGTEL